MLCAVTSTWAEEASLNAFPTGTTSFANYNWGNSLDKNKVIYDQGNYIMMWSNGNNLAVDANGLKIGNSSKKSAFVFRVENASDITVGIARNGSDMTASLYYLGETTDVLTDPNSMTPTGALSSVNITASNSSAELSVEEGAAGYYMVFGTLRFYATSITITPTGPITKSVTFINDAGWENVYVWAWNDSENFTGGEWPGVKMTAVDGEENTYTWSTTGDPTKIIFSDGGSAQTANLDFVDGGKYNSGGRIKTAFSATLSTDLETVYAYVWSGNGDGAYNKALGDWPGTELTAEGDAFVVNFLAEDAPEHIIFHNNEGIQTEDLAFADGEAYEFRKIDYTASFTTDAGWENVYAYVWSGSGNNVTKITGDYPGTEITETDGVYSLSFSSYVVPQKIQFNGGSGDNKTPDWNFVDGKAYKWITATPLYALTANQTFTSGQTVEVKDADGDVVATITYGEEGGDNFNTTKSSTVEGYAGYTHCTEGNGTNGDVEGGTFYTIVPQYDGTIDLAVIINANKTLVVEEDGDAIAGFETQAEKLYGIQSFEVKAGKSYKCYVAGSKLGFYGFDYKFEKVSDYYIIVDNGTEWVALGKMNYFDDMKEYDYSLDNTWTGKYFAIAPASALNADGSVADWEKVVRPKTESGNYLVELRNYYDEVVIGGNNVWEKADEITRLSIHYYIDVQDFALYPQFDVTISDAGYATYSNKYDYYTGDAKVSIVKNVEGNEAVLEELEFLDGTNKGISGGTGVILEKVFAEMDVVTIYPYDKEEYNEYVDVTGNMLIGSGNSTYDITGYDTSVGEYKAYILADRTNGVGFYPLASYTEDNQLAAHKAFLAVPKNQSAPDFIGFGDTTGIDATLNDNGQMINDNVIYDLSGRRVMNPTKGLYIINGKKVVIK